MINHFKYIFTKWNDTITQRLGDDAPNRSIKEDLGPRSELEYWRLRMQKLYCLSQEM